MWSFSEKWFYLCDVVIVNDAESREWRWPVAHLVVTRGADGHWRVLADRTQSPSGPGYALENRLVLTRVTEGSLDDAAAWRLHRRQP